MSKFKKYLLLITAIFLLFIAISSSFAQEFDDNLTIYEDDSVIAEDNPVSEYYFNASLDRDDGNGSKENPYKYLKADRIKDNSNIYLANGEYSLDKSKTVKDVNIIGSDANKTILKFSGKIFTVSSPLTLTNMTLVGSTITLNSNLNATNTVFSSGKGISVDYYNNNYGGAIYAPSDGVTICIKNSTFKDNRAEYGGAIYLAKGNLIISDSVFMDNYATSFGGAIACENSYNVTISKSRFINSKSLSDAGGAIYIKYSSLNLTDTEVINSSATFGGAVTSLSTKVQLINFTAKNNSAVWAGGAVFHMYGDFTSLNGSFMNNSANSGGALFIDTCENLKLNSNVFSNNCANLTARAVYSLCSNLSDAESVRSGNEFTGNTAYFQNDEYEPDAINLTIASGNYSLYNNNVPDAEILPSSYSLVNDNLITVAKDQQSSGSCWAFAPLAVYESAILKVAGESFDFSEENMKNVMAKFSDYGWNVNTNDGGNIGMMIGYLVSWLGPVLDSDDLYDDKSTLSAVLNSVAHLQNVMFMTRTNYTDNDAIKRALLKYGAVGTSMTYYGGYIKNNNYYYTQNGDLNHAVVIVGWDDNYSKTNFWKTAPGDGAWIVRNSWGSNWGNDGNFYVSYYDTKFAQINDDELTYVFILNDTIRYDRNYQYDIAGKTDYLFTYADELWYKNIYTAVDDEYLAGVSTYFNKFTNWQVSVHVNGEVKAIKNGSCDNGYYTIKLDDFIPLKKGDNFTVEFKVDGPGVCTVPISEAVSLNKYAYREGISYFSYDGVNWTDLYYFSSDDLYPGHRYYSQVACLKAFTFLNEIKTFINLNVTDEEVIISVADEYGNVFDNMNLTLNINGAEYVKLITDGAVILKKSDFGSLLNTIDVTFSRTGYETAFKHCEVSFPPEMINLRLDISEYRNNVSIKFTASKNINESVILTIGDENYTINLTDGKYVMNLNNLPNAVYNVKYSYDLGYYNYTIINSQFTIQVNDSKILSDDFMTYYMSGELFSIVLVDSQSNQTLPKRLVLFTIDNKTLPGWTNGNGVASLPLKLTNGIHAIKISFSGDENHFASDAENSINVSSDVDISLNADQDENNVVIAVNLSKPVNATLTVNVNGKNHFINSTNGKALINLSNLAGGYYHVSVSLDDKNYTSSPKSTDFTINKSDSLIRNVSAVPVIEGAVSVIVVEMNSTESGFVVVEVGGLNYTAIIDGGVAVLNLTLSESVQGKVYYLGDDYFNAAEVMEFTAAVYPKSVSVIVIDDADLIIGEAVEFTARVNGFEAEITYLINGVPGNRISCVGAGVYTVTAIFEGNSTHKANSTVKTFNVTKYDSLIMNVSAVPVIEGAVSVIVVEMNSTESGFVVVEVGGLNYTANIDGGVAVLNLTLDKSVHGYVYYLGDEYFNAADVMEFTAVVYPKSVSVIVIDDADLIIGEAVEFTARVNGFEAEITYLVNGVPGNRISCVGAGVYTVTAIFEGNSTHKANSTVKTFNVTKYDSLIRSVSAVPVIEGAVSVIVVRMNSTESGFVVVEVGGLNYTANIDGGVAVLNLTLSESAPARVYYPGDYRFAPAQAKNFTIEVIEKFASIIEINDVDLTIGDFAVFTANLNGVTVYDLLFTVNGRKGNNISNVSVGSYFVSATFTGNATHKANTTSREFIVHEDDLSAKADSIITIDDADLIIGEKVTFTARINNEYVDGLIIAVNGVYGANVDEVAVGRYIVSAIFIGNDTHKANSTVREFLVDKEDSLIRNISVNPVVEGALSVIDVEMGGLESGFVIVEVGGVNYTANIEGGHAFLEVMLGETSSGWVYYPGDERFYACGPEGFDAVVNPKSDSLIVIDDVTLTIGEAVIFTAGVNGHAADLTFLVNGIEKNCIEYVLEGNYTVTVSFEGNSTHKANSTTRSFSVYKSDSFIIDVSVSPVVEGGVSVIDVEMGGLESGFVIVEVGGVNYTANIEGGHAFLEVMLGETSSGWVYYPGDERFYACGPEGFDAVVNPKSDSVIVIDDVTLTIGEAVIFTAGVNGHAADLTFLVNGIEKNCIEHVLEGNYTVTVSFEGNSTHKANSTTKIFSVYKSDSLISNISVSPVVEGAVSVIDVEMGGLESGFVIVEVGGVNYTANIEGGHAFLEVMLGETSSGWVYYPGDERFYACGPEGFDAVVNPKSDSVIVIDDVTLTIGEAVTFTANVNGDSSGLTFSVNGVLKDTVECVSSGSYTVTVSFAGNATHRANSTTKTFTVNKIPSAVSIGDIPSQTVNKQFTISIDNDSDVTVTINGKKYSVVNGVVNVGGLASGQYTVVASIAENDKYTASSDTKTFFVVKNNAVIEKIDAGSVIDGQTAAVRVKMANVSEGSIVIEVNDVNYTVEIRDNVAVLNLLLPVGTYTAKAYFLEDDSYYSANASSEIFTVKDKSDSVIVIDDAALGIGKAVTFTAKVNGADAELSFTVNGVEGNAVDSISAGNYIVTAAFAGNSTHKANSTSRIFTVSKLDVYLKSDSVSAFENEDLAIRVEISDNASGMIIIGIGNHRYYGEIEDGIADVIINNLDVGNYTAEIRYPGDDRFNGADGQINIEIKAIQLITTDIRANCSDIMEGDVLTIDIDLDCVDFGLVYVDVGDRKIYAEIDGGFTSVSVHGLPAGSYVASISFLGDDVYEGSSTTLSFVVDEAVKPVPDPLIPTSIDAYCDSTVEGDALRIDINVEGVESGVVFVDIGDMKFYSCIDDGAASVSVYGLPAGSYAASISFLGDDVYEGSSATLDITVNKAVKPVPAPLIPTAIVASANQIVEGETLTVDIKVSNVSDGIVFVDIADKKVYCNIDAGAASVSVEGLEAGSYVASVTYSGDDEHLNSSAKIDVTVTEKEKQVIDPLIPTAIEAEISEVREGETLTVNVSLTDGAEGIVLLDIADNKLYSFTDGSKASFSIGGLSCGSYIALISYLGNSGYENATKSFNINVGEKETVVQKTDADIAIDLVSEIQYGETPVLSLKLPDGATGNVIVKVDGKEISNISVSKADIQVPFENMSAGSYIVEVIYSGDNKYNPSSDFKQVNVNKQKTVKKDTIIVVDAKFTRVATDYNAGERGAFFYATLRDISGNPLTNKTVQIAVNGPIYNVTTDEEGRAGLQVNLAQANIYTYALSFMGDENYNAAPLASSKLTVTLKKTSIAAKSAVFKKSQKTKTVTATLKTTKNPYDGRTYLKKGKLMTLKVNGKTYTASTNAKGVAKFSVQLAKKGEFTAKVSFAGDRTYASSAKSIKITVK